MKASELIKELQWLVKDKGDTDVYVWSAYQSGSSNIEWFASPAEKVYYSNKTKHDYVEGID